MKDTAKLPKTFLVLAEDENGKTGYVRFTSYIAHGDEIMYGMKLVRKISEASRYITLDNSKTKARELKEKYGFVSVQVIDEATGKAYVIS